MKSPALRDSGEALAVLGSPVLVLAVFDAVPKLVEEFNAQEVDPQKERCR